jgi:hypothetical protein
LLVKGGTKWRAARFRAGVCIIVTRTSKTKAPGIAAPDPKAVEAIGRALKAHYANLVQAPLPDKFSELLARFEVAGRAAEPRGNGDAIG